MGRRIWWLNVLLAGLALWVGWRTWLFWTLPEPDAPSPATAAAPARTAAPPLELPAAPGPEEFRIIEEKNLFAQTRAPAPPAPAPAAEARPVVPPENLQERYVLYGVIRVGPNRAYALIRDRKTPNAKQRTYKEGDILPGSHVLRRIEDQRVIVASGLGETEIRLRSPKGAEDTSFVPRAVPQATVPGLVPGAASPTPQPGVQRPGMPLQNQPGAALKQPPPRRPVAPAPPVMDEEDEDDMDMEDEEDFMDEEDMEEEE